MTFRSDENKWTDYIIDITDEKLKSGHRLVVFINLSQFADLQWMRGRHASSDNQELSIRYIYEQISFWSLLMSLNSIHTDSKRTEMNMRMKKRKTRGWISSKDYKATKWNKGDEKNQRKRWEEKNWNTNVRWKENEKDYKMLMNNK